MRMWQVIKGMNERVYKAGDIFKSADFGDMIIDEDEELIWVDDKSIVSMMVGDYSEWEVSARDGDE